MFSQLLVSGIAQGALYALIALAMTVIYRSTTVVNFGHGDFVMRSEERRGGKECLCWG